MNYITLLNPDSAIVDYVPLKYTVYFYLLSVLEVNTTKNVLTSKYSLRELHDKFGFFDADQINQAISELRSENLLIVDKKGGLTLGVTDKGEHKLIGSKIDSSVEDYKRELMLLADKFNDIAEGMAIVTARVNKRDLDHLMSLPFAEWRLNELVMLFNVAYTSLYQQPFRALTGKEVGQLKLIFTNYQMSVMFKMVIHYVFNSEKYGRNLGFGLFIFHRDKIYGIVTEKSAEKVKMSTMRTKSVKDDDESFI